MQRKALLAVAAVVAAAGTGLWVGQTELLKLPIPATITRCSAP